MRKNGEQLGKHGENMWIGHDFCCLHFMKLWDFTWFEHVQHGNWWSIHPDISEDFLIKLDISEDGVIRTKQALCLEKTNNLCSSLRLPAAGHGDEWWDEWCFTVILREKSLANPREWDFFRRIQSRRPHQQWDSPYKGSVLKKPSEWWDDQCENLVGGWATSLKNMKVNWDD